MNAFVATHSLGHERRFASSGADVVSDHTTTAATAAATVRHPVITAILAQLTHIPTDISIPREHGTKLFLYF